MLYYLSSSGLDIYHIHVIRIRCSSDDFIHLSKFLKIKDTDWILQPTITEWLQTYVGIRDDSWRLLIQANSLSYGIFVNLKFKEKKHAMLFKLKWS